MIRPLIPTPPFLREVRALSRRNRRVASAITATLALLTQDAFDPRLKTHKLVGNMAEYWACSVGYDIRIVFEFVHPTDSAESILLHSCGTHDDVY